MGGKGQIKVNMTEPLMRFWVIFIDKTTSNLDIFSTLGIFIVKENTMWKKHPIYENYEANESGEIRSLDYGKNGKPKIVKQTRKKDGYVIFSVRGKNIFSHRFVWECFNGLLEKGEAVDHLNTIRDDNRIENLRKGNYTSNMSNELTRLHLREAKAKQCGKKVLKLDKHTGEILGWYPSIAEATRANKISCTNYIRYVCEGRKGFYTAGGFKWTY